MIGSTKGNKILKKLIDSIVHVRTI